MYWSKRKSCVQVHADSPDDSRTRKSAYRYRRCRRTCGYLVKSSAVGCCGSPAEEGCPATPCQPASGWALAAACKIPPLSLRAVKIGNQIRSGKQTYKAVRCVGRCFGAEALEALPLLLTRSAGEVRIPWLVPPTPSSCNVLLRLPAQTTRQRAATPRLASFERDHHLPPWNWTLPLLTRLLLRSSDTKTTRPASFMGVAVRTLHTPKAALRSDDPTRQDCM